MNRVYRLVWSQTAAAFVAVAEFVTRRGKAGAVVGASLSLLGIASAHALDPNALPTGGTVSAGVASISQTANQLTVNQSSQRAVLDWQSFNIGAAASVNFIQPSSSAVALNRILGNEASQIYGKLTSNGQVFFTNPNGMLFARGAEINVGGILATTLNISNADFMAGNHRFSAPGSGAIRNEGLIQAANGVILAGRTVENTGSIVSAYVSLVAGTTVDVDLTGDGLIAARVKDADLSAQVQNSGNIEGTVVTLSAGQARSTLAGVVNNSGIVRATGLSIRNGEIVLEGGTVSNAGVLDASSSEALGGKIALRAENIALENGSRITASGKTAGGEVLVIGGMETGSLSVSGVIDASSSDGDGGFVETSAANLQISETTRVTTLAPRGQAGTWLIDPVDFTIAAGSGTLTTSGIGSTTLATNLGGGNVTITTDASTGGNGDIFVNDAVSWSANKLTLSAHRNININATLNGSGTASLAFEYGQSAVATGNTSTYNIYAPVNLPAGNNFSTKLGTDGSTITYTVITSLGAQGSTTTTDLQGIRGNLAGNYALGANIDASATSSWNSGAGFDMLGVWDSNTHYTGKFDGLGHTVSNLTINRPALYVQGLFSTTQNATISNVGVVGGTITGNGYVGGLIGDSDNTTITNSYSSATINSPQARAGGLVGNIRNGGAIKNSYATGNVNGTNASLSDVIGGLVGWNAGGAITNSYATGAVSAASRQHVGGLVGYNESGASVSNSYATGTVTGDGNVGGLVGWNNGTAISDSYATGNLVTTGNGVGGIAGNNGGTITRAYATGSVPTGTQHGGVVGYNGGTVTNSYWDTTTSGNASGIGSASSSTTGTTGLTTTQMLTASNFTGFNFTTTAGATGNNWVIVDTDGTLNNAGSVAGAFRPMLASEYSTALINSRQVRLTAMATGVTHKLVGSITETEGTLTLWSNASIDQSVSLISSGGDVFVKGNITKTAGGTETLTLRATGNVTLGANSTITSSVGQLNAVLNSDSDATSGGGIVLNAGASISSNGGAITLAGGSGGSGYAEGTSTSSNHGIYFSNSGTASLSSSGGDITLRGKSGVCTSGVCFGILLDSTTGTLNSGTGSISLDGLAMGNSTGNTQAIIVGAGTTLTSTKTSGTAISLTGSASGAGTTGFGVGINISGTLAATGGGGIAITGTGGASAAALSGFGADIQSGAKILASSGAIDITATSGNANSSDFRGQGIYIGQKAGSAVTSSSSNITLNVNSLDLAGADELSSSGALLVQPRTAATTIGIAGGTGTLNLPASYFSTKFVNGFSGITIGSATTGTITTNGFTFADNLTLWAGNAGADINLSGTIANAGTGTSSGSLTAKAAGSIVLASSTSVTTQNQALLLNSDSDASSAGAIDVNAGTTIATNGGALTLAGGTSGVGYAAGDATKLNGIDFRSGAASSLNSGGGDIVLRGKSSTNSGVTTLGIYLNNSLTIDSGAGSITLDGLALGTGASTNSQGVVSGAGVSLVSSKASGTAISITGDSSASTGTTEVNGINLAGTFAATGGGGITITGVGGATATGANTASGLYSSPATNILASSGAISVTATAGHANSVDFYGDNIFLGQKAATSVTNSSSNITLNADTWSLTANARLQSSGALVVKARTASTTIGIAGATGTLALPASYFSTNFVDGFSSITVGRSDGTGKITAAGFTVTENLTLLNSTGNIELTGVLNAGSNSVTLNTTGTGTDTGSGAITAGTLNLLGTGASYTLDAASNDVTTLTATTGGVTYVDATALALGAMTLTGNLSATSTNAALTQSGILSITGTSSFSAGAAAITLANASNDFTGAVSLANSGANNVTLTDVNALVLGTVGVGTGTLNITAGGALTQSGVITQAASAGAASFSVGANAITLTNAGNDFTGAVSLSNTGANNVALTDTNALILGTLGVGTGTLSITAGGALTQSGAITQAATAGAASFSVGANAITLTNAGNDFTGVAILSNSGANDVAITDANSISLGGGTFAGNLAVTSNGALTQSGAWTVAGTTTVNAGAGFITLSNASNDFTGAVSISNTGANNVALTDLNALILAAVSVGTGTLTVTAGGALTQSGAITQAASAGAASFSVGANAITLTNAGNDFTGAVSLSNSGANNVSLTDSNALVLGTLGVGTGALTITAGGALTQSGAITQAASAGATSFSTGANAITLTHASNDFTGTVTLSNSGANNVAITDANALALAGGSFGGNLSVTGNGALTQTGAWAVTGTTTVNAGAGSITLTNASNDFSGAVSLSNSGANNVALTDANGLTLGTFGVGTGTLGITFGGNLSQTGALTQAASAGAFTLTATSAATDIALASQANDLSGAVTIGGTATNVRDFALRNINASAAVPTLTGASNLRNLTLTFNNAALQLPSLTLASAGTMTVAAGGAITQAAGGIVVPGTASFSSVGNTITLTDAGNDFQGAVSLSDTGSGTVAVRDANTLDLGTVSVAGNFSATTAGALTDSGNLSITGTTTLTAGSANNITLDSANNFGGSVSVVSGNNVTLNDTGAISLAASTISGNLSVTAGGAITETGTITVTGTKTLNGTAAASTTTTTTATTVAAATTAATTAVQAATTVTTTTTVTTGTDTQAFGGGSGSSTLIGSGSETTATGSGGTDSSATSSTSSASGSSAESGGSTSSTAKSQDSSNEGSKEESKSSEKKEEKSKEKSESAAPKAPTLTTSTASNKPSESVIVTEKPKGSKLICKAPA